MAQTHDIGNWFVQVVNLPVHWGGRLWSRGWTQEIEPPFRTSSPLLVRLPGHRAVALGRWTGQAEDEESALHTAIQGRVLADEDFDEGWEPPAYQAPETDFWALNT